MFTFFQNPTRAVVFRLLGLLLGRGGSSRMLIIGRDRLNLVHVRDGGLQVGIRAELLLGHAKQLTHVDRLARVTVDHAEQTLRRDAVILRRIVLLALVAGHLPTHIVQF